MFSIQKQVLLNQSMADQSSLVKLFHVDMKPNIFTCYSKTLFSLYLAFLVEGGAVKPAVWMSSQAILTRTPPATKWFLMDQNVLNRSLPVTGPPSGSDWVSTELWLTLQQHHQQRRSRWKEAASPSCGPEAHCHPSEPAGRGAEPEEGRARGPR